MNPAKSSETIFRLFQTYFVLMYIFFSYELAPWLFEFSLGDLFKSAVYLPLKKDCSCSHSPMRAYHGSVFLFPNQLRLKSAGLNTSIQ